MSEFAMATKEKYEIKYAITEVEALGYGNPDSPISYEKQIESGELPTEVAAYAAELIGSGECMVDVTEADDGCIDGRPAVKLSSITSSAEVRESPDKYDGEGHNRYKVAGGGYMTGLAMRHALGQHAATPGDDIRTLGAAFAEAGVVCGAHEDTHATGGGTGCGANDKYRLILQNAGKFNDQIAATTQALLGVGGVEFRDTAYDASAMHWQAIANDEQYFADETGRKRFDAIVDVIADVQGDNERPVAVSKLLDGDHKEDFIVVNYVEGKTLSQQLLQQKLKQQFPDLPSEKLAQAFVVDVPRIVELAKSIASTDEEFLAALHAGVAYQLATAATLTDGTLRNMLVTADS